jgi:hypothetical protein
MEAEMNAKTPEINTNADTVKTHMRKVDDCQNQEHPKSRKKKGQICYVSIE